MSILCWIAVGGLVGLVVERLKRGPFQGDRREAGATGTLGVLVGGGVFTVLDGPAFAPVTVVGALVGAMLLLAAMHETDRSEPRPN